MHNTLKHKQHGFSLLEMAIVFILAGIIITPAVSLYHQYTVEKDWDETEERIGEIANAIGNYRAVYGRYPCPASRTASSGDLDYGREKCQLNSPGSCNDGICTFENNGKPNLVGTIPFKALNMQETEASDKYLNRFTYAVTNDLTSNTTFNLQGGALGIVDKNGNSLVQPADSGHFIVISHGPNKIGAYTKEGVNGRACSQASLIEQENCDDDAIFVAGEVESDIDDRVSYFSPVYPSEWQISEATPNNDIHLKNTNALSVGANINNDLSAAEETTIRDTALEPGVLKSEDKIFTEELCEYDGTDVTLDCFKPRRIAGMLDTGGPLLAETINKSGMSCYDPTQTPADQGFLVGIKDGNPECSEEIYISCPANGFISAIDSAGNVICTAAPDPPCATEVHTNFCQEPVTLNATYSGAVQTAFSGECRMITDYNSAYFTAAIGGMTFADMQTEIATLNAETRTIVDCSSGNASQIRDAFRCNSGTWSLVASHEKRRPTYSFISNATSTSSTYTAETGYTGNDNNNNIGNHDCWCREDYRVNEDTACPWGTFGTRKRVYKHKCPQTDHYWDLVYTDTQSCACAPFTIPQTMSCNAYYDQQNGTSGTTGLSGTVYLSYLTTCSGNTPVVPTTPTSVNASQCKCNPISSTDRNNCDTGTTNNWTSPFGTEIGVELITEKTYACPNTTTGGLPDPRSKTPTTNTYGPEACVCDTNLKSNKTVACPTGLSGVGITYEREWDCVANDWEPEEDWDVVSNQCYGCAWEGSGASTLEEYAYGKEKGTSCACGTAPVAFCWDYAANSKYSVSTSCQCTVQLP